MLVGSVVAGVVVETVAIVSSVVEVGFVAGDILVVEVVNEGTRSGSVVVGMEYSKLHPAKSRMQHMDTRKIVKMLFFIAFTIKQ